MIVRSLGLRVLGDFVVVRGSFGHCGGAKDVNHCGRTVQPNRGQPNSGMAFRVEHQFPSRLLQTVVLVLWTILFIVDKLFAFLHGGLERLLSLLETFLVNGKPATVAQPQQIPSSGRPTIFTGTPRAHPQQNNISGRAPIPAPITATVVNTDVECRSDANSSGAIQKPYNCTLGCAKQNKYYAVARGRVPDIYRTWTETNAQVHEFRGALHKSFKSLSEAEAWQEREFIAMGLKWRKNDMGPEHRQKVDFLGIDEQGHDVYRCRCCDEVFCMN